MAYFSENDINEAKKRVNDMQKRAKSLTNDNDKEHKKTDDEKSPFPYPWMLSAFRFFFDNFGSYYASFPRGCG